VAAARRIDQGGARGLLLPTGALVVVALAPFWDFATSGLETGLIFAWLGLSALAVARLSDGSGGGRGQEPAWPAAVLVGLGPLVRPDLAIPAAALFAALLVLRARSVQHALALGAAAAALPLAYQVFRMGYFAALVPNTAIAKEGGAARWGQGLLYLFDFGGPYWLWLPLAVLGGEWLRELVPQLRARRWRSVALLALPPIGGITHAVYVVRVGGDFMHGRMLLPSLFALLLPVMATAVRLPVRTPRALFTPVALALWALVCALWLRPPYHQVGNGLGPHGIADERWFYVRFSGNAHPVTLADYDRTSWKRAGDALRLLAERERVVLPWPPDVLDVLQEEQRRLRAERERVVLPRPTDVLDILLQEQRRLPPGEWVPARVVLSVKNIGLLGYAAGPRVHVVDQLGLADPIAARIRLDSRGRPGHEKDLPGEWVVARFAAPEALPRSALTPESQRRVLDARAALECGPLRYLLPAVEGPLGWQEVARNLRAAAGLTAIRLPADPTEARGVLCGPTA
jgi:arabinofuranosyltransferase